MQRAAHKHESARLLQRTSSRSPVSSRQSPEITTTRARRRTRREHGAGPDASTAPDPTLELTGVPEAALDGANTHESARLIADLLALRRHHLRD